jgi:hypothetical protein
MAVIRSLIDRPCLRTYIIDADTGPEDVEAPGAELRKRSAV